MSKEEQTSDDVHIAPEREDRFRWNSVDDVEWLDEDEEDEGEEGGPELALEGDESEEDDDDGPVCQGPFWPSPDDPNTGYCTCCEQPYYGDLQSHPCLSADNDQDDDDGEIEDDGDEDTAKRPAVRP